MPASSSGRDAVPATSRSLVPHRGGPRSWRTRRSSGPCRRPNGPSSDEGCSLRFRCTTGARSCCDVEVDAADTGSGKSETTRVRPRATAVATGRRWRPPIPRGGTRRGRAGPDDRRRTLGSPDRFPPSAGCAASTQRGTTFCVGWPASVRRSRRGSLTEPYRCRLDRRHWTTIQTITTTSSTAQMTFGATCGP